MEQAVGNESLGKEEMPRFTSPVRIHVTSYRKRKHDPDGVSIKAFVDGIVALGILSDDSWDEVASVAFESRKAEKGEEERTVIEIESA